MARDRRDLSPIFKGILGNENVYFQSPAPHMLRYPCILYEIDKRDTHHANDHVYKDMNRYTVTLIDRNPDNDDYVDQLINLQYCSHDRRFISDNLYHDVFNLYY